MSALKDIAGFCGLPADAIPTEAVVVLSYIDEDGDHGMGHATIGDPLLITALGLLAWAQIQLTLDTGDTE
ncbi:MAG: hypothetical protein IPH48_17620 [bacterium]|nr:hypothetical protein [bacterium]